MVGVGGAQERLKPKSSDRTKATHPPTHTPSSPFASSSGWAPLFSRLAHVGRGRPELLARVWGGFCMPQSRAVCSTALKGARCSSREGISENWDCPHMNSPPPAAAAAAAYRRLFFFFSKGRCQGQARGPRVAEPPASLRPRPSPASKRAPLISERGSGLLARRGAAS